MRVDVVTNTSPFPFCYWWSVCCGPLVGPRSALDLSELITVPGQSWAVFAPVPAGELLRSQSPVEAAVHRAGKERLGLAAFDNVTQKPGVCFSSCSPKLNFEK